MAEKVVSKLRGNMWRLIILAVAGSPDLRTALFQDLLL